MDTLCLIQRIIYLCLFFFFQAEDGIRDKLVTGVQTCALPIAEDRDLVAAAPVPGDLDLAMRARLVKSAVPIGPGDYRAELERLEGVFNPKRMAVCRDVAEPLARLARRQSRASNVVGWVGAGK